MEFLLIVTKIYLTENSPNTKIILMSATFDTDEFANYFRTPQYDEMIKAPTVNLDSPRLFKIKHFYLDDLEQIASKAVFEDEPGITSSLYAVAISLVGIFCKQEEEETSTQCRTILIFLPGLHEIQEMYRLLSEQMQR